MIKELGFSDDYVLVTQFSDVVNTADLEAYLNSDGVCPTGHTLREYDLLGDTLYAYWNHDTDEDVEKWEALEVKRVNLAYWRNLL